ncbi:nuclear transport factor 2 family protein [Alteraurantiacibacter aquimixticola]|uniref:Nuclear transport factor 2 family protein n=1 Tax=Alteraurantiacibacter aquimixticola TaxID=2489173 RepID=A0A4T3EY82_9SPHN|nr:nuclear transport factor 2 family protein [Alteraurantiacibacter aquimixticola]TIX49481.1 nuclear transport factor 2 family protein [Alteraurantiacibacter aquimixticola]
MTIWRNAKLALGAAGLALAATAPAPALAEQPAYNAGYAEDRAQIEDLMARYLFAIDFHDWDAYVETFAPDGTIEFASGTYTGREAIREAVTRFAEGIGNFYQTEDGQPAKLRHVILQSTVRVEGDRAWATSLWVEMANDGPGDSLKMGTFGTYEDQLAKIDGQWLLTYRNVLNDFIPNRNPGPENPVRAMDAAAEAYRNR